MPPPSPKTSGLASQVGGGRVVVGLLPLHARYWVLCGRCDLRHAGSHPCALRSDESTTLQAAAWRRSLRRPRHPMHTTSSPHCPRGEAARLLNSQLQRAQLHQPACTPRLVLHAGSTQVSVLCVPALHRPCPCVQLRHTCGREGRADVGRAEAAHRHCARNLEEPQGGAAGPMHCMRE